jgi:4-amino-4-deoxy-L-arabinose transferase-like glycosyltransferase
LVVIALLFACRLLTAIVIIPPWQNPDEPAHYLVVAAARSELDDQYRSPSISQISASLYAHDWWKYYGSRRPDTPPAVLPVGTGVDGPLLYYQMAARVVAAFGAESLVGQLYALRFLSAFWALISIVVTWSASRVVGGRPLAVVVSAVVALHPQFVIAATTAGPDAAVNFLGTVVWWAAGIILVHRSSWALVLLWTAAVAAFMTKRIGAPLVGLAALMSAWHLFAQTGRRGHKAAIVVLLVASMVATGWFAEAVVQRAWTAVMHDFRYWGPGDVEPSVRFFSSFTWILFQSSWLVAGWMRHELNALWYWALAVVSVLSAVGLGLSMARRRRQPSSTLGVMRSVLVAGLVFTAAFVVAVYAVYFMLGEGGQGRYLFPVLVPGITLWVVGVSATMPCRWSRWVGPALVTLVAVTDVAGWALMFSTFAQ